MANLTPHIEANKGDFAETVLMPGDPLRAKFISENYLENAKLINQIRGILAYTGEYNGKKVSVMASGMGIPSMGIYSYELYQTFGVENIIRIGTAGAINNEIKLKDVIIAMGACTDSNYVSQYNLDGNYSAIADYSLLNKAVETAKQIELPVRVGNILTSDVFYDENKERYNNWAKMGILAVEMETAGLYMNAARLGKKALTICTVSDHLLKNEHCTAEERQNSFSNMMKLALEVATK